MHQLMVAGDAVHSTSFHAPYSLVNESRGASPTGFHQHSTHTLSTCQPRFWIFAQLSFRVTLRLNTRAGDRASRVK
jgi:hypothetical protein